PVLQRLRRQPVPAIQKSGPLARLRLRGEDIHRAVVSGEVSAGVAGLLWHAPTELAQFAAIGGVMAQDRIDIKNLLLRTIIGLNDWEREKRQDVLINLTLFTDMRAAGQSDDAADI